MSEPQTQGQDAAQPAPAPTPLTEPLVPPEASSPKVSSLVTGGLGVTAASLAPFVDWAIHSFQGPPPPYAAYYVSAGILAGAHALYNLATTRSKP